MGTVAARFALPRLDATYGVVGATTTSPPPLGHRAGPNVDPTPLLQDHVSLRIADTTVPVTWLHPRNGSVVSFSPSAIPLVRCAAPASATRARCPFVYCHGNAEDVGTCHAWCRYLAERFGRDCYLFDYQGYGTNGEAASETAVYANVVSVLRFLGRKRISEVVVFGRSLGTAPAVYAATDARLAGTGSAQPVGLVLESAFRSIVTTKVPFRIPSCFDLMCTERRLPRCTVSTLLVHGTDDAVVPFSHGETLARTSPCVWGHCWLQHAGHNDIDGTVAWRDEMCAKIDHFLASAVDPWVGGTGAGDDDPQMTQQISAPSSEKFKKWK
jgi:hypothetical protein